MALPSNVTFGTVVAKFLTATADSPDDVDRDPEGNPATGLSVVFTPVLFPAIARVAGASPPVIFALADVQGTIGSDGTLRGSDGQPGIKLVAGTNPALDPYGWPWKVTISGPGYPKLEFSFALGGGDTVDLASVVQVPSAPGQTLSQWLAAVADARAARDAAIAAAASVPSAAQLAATYSPLLPNVGSLTYDGNGNVTQDQDGTAYTYNTDGTVATITRGSTTRTLSYNTDGTIAGVA